MPAPTLLNVARPQAFGYGLSLDARLFRVAAGPGRELQIQTAPLEAPRVNTTSSAEEASTDFGLTFARSQFAGGQGLFRAHTEDAEPNRFWDSKNVSVRPARPGEFPEVRLLHTTEVIEESAATGLRLAFDGASLYMTGGAVLRRTDDPDADTPTWADDNPDAGEVVTDVADVAVLGTDVYAVVDDGIHRKRSGTWTHWADEPVGENYQRVWAVKGRIVASDGRSLYEVVDPGGAAPDALHILPTGLEWTDVCDGGSHILAAASDGYTYAFTTDSGSMALAAQTLFEGEVPRAVGQTQGIVAIGTESGTLGRWYVGVVSDSGQIAELQLVREWSGNSPRAIAATRSALVTGVPDGTDTFLWRYDVSTDGVSRDLTLGGESGNVSGVAYIDGVAFATVDGAGLFRETGEYADEGWLIGPLGDFYSPDDKSWVGAEVTTSEVDSGQRVRLFYSTEPDALADPSDSSWVRAINMVSGNEADAPLVGVVSRSLAGMVKLRPSTDKTSTPAVRSFSFRAFPASGDEEWIVQVPVNVSDQIERRGVGRRRVKGRGRAEYGALADFAGRPALLQLFDPPERLRGIVEQVAAPVQAQTWRGSSTMVSMMTFRGSRVGGGGLGQSESSFGVGQLGVMNLGGTEEVA